MTMASKLEVENEYQWLALVLTKLCGEQKVARSLSCVPVSLFPTLTWPTCTCLQAACRRA